MLIAIVPRRMSRDCRCDGAEGSRRPTVSFRLLETGGGKARHVSLNGRFRAGVLTGDWCFQRHPAAQTFSYSASGLRHPVWHVEKADAELSFAANRLLEGEIRVFVWLACEG